MPDPCVVLVHLEFLLDGPLLPSLGKRKRRLSLLGRLCPQVSLFFFHWSHTVCNLSSNAVTYMLACVIGGKYLHNIGREVAIIVGMLLVLL